MKIEIVNLDRIHGRKEKRRVGKKRMIPNAATREIIQKIMTVERQRH